MQNVFIANELDKKMLREWFIYCSNNNITLQNDYTEFIKINNL